MIRGKRISRRWCLTVILLCSAFPLASQGRNSKEPTPSSARCEEQDDALASGAYVYSVFDRIEPPDLHLGISVAVQYGYGRKVVLYTDGEKYDLWLGIAEVPDENVWAYLRELANSCKLPPDPAEAVKLLNIHWERREMQRAQFEQLHQGFLSAFAQYTSEVKENSAYSLATGLFVVPVDALFFTIVYDNSWEHFKIQEFYLNNDKKTSLGIWAKELRNFAEQTFHTDPKEPPRPTTK